MAVVSYRNSTSNHNHTGRNLCGAWVVSYRNSTSNHNSPQWWTICVRLYLIEILHQTTTFRRKILRLCGCILSKFYIKPQLAASAKIACVGCILSKFYIKPQPEIMAAYRNGVVSYRNSTSNHNSCWCKSYSVELYLIEILHQTTTVRPTDQPQPELYLIEILHQTTTPPIT